MDDCSELKKEINKWGNNLKRKIVAAYRMGNALKDEALVTVLKTSLHQSLEMGRGPSKHRDGRSTTAP